MKRLLFIPLLVTAALAQWPDAGGYRVLTSDTAAGPAFDWVDISACGTRLALGDDDNSGFLPLGFSFRFYGQDYDSVAVCSNGWLSFTSASHQFHHFPIPDPREPNALAAPLWMDLDPAQGGNVYYYADTARHRFIVSWVAVPIHDSTDNCTFEAVIDTSGDVLFEYNVLPLGMRVGEYDFTVGLENAAGNVGYEYQYDNLHADTRLHDSLALRFFQLDYDACVFSIVRPVPFPLAGDSVVPLVKVWNAGRRPATFPVTLRITPGYEQQVTLVNLPSLAETLVAFPTWVPAEDTYWLEAFAGLDSDGYRLNDSASGFAFASYVGQMYYDDGEPDTWFLRNGTPSVQWAAAVRFSPPWARYRLRRLMVALRDSQPLARVLVCPDSSGAPRVAAPYFSADSVRANQPDSWLVLGVDTAVATSDDIWLVMFWRSRATGPAIGEDDDPPLDHRSYYGSPAVRWLPYSSGDLVARLEVDGRTGIAELAPAGVRQLLAAGPNPFRRTLAIRGDAAEYRVFDTNGRQVRRLAARAGTATWDGRDGAGLPVNSGVYFIEASTSAGPGRLKVLLAR